MTVVQVIIIQTIREGIPAIDGSQSPLQTVFVDIQMIEEKQIIPQQVPVTHINDLLWITEDIIQNHTRADHMQTLGIIEEIHMDQTGEIQFKTELILINITQTNGMIGVVIQIGDGQVRTIIHTTDKTTIGDKLPVSNRSGQYDMTKVHRTYKVSCNNKHFVY